MCWALVFSDSGASGKYQCSWRHPWNLENWANQEFAAGMGGVASLETETSEQACFGETSTIKICTMAAGTFAWRKHHVFCLGPLASAGSSSWKSCCKTTEDNGILRASIGSAVFSINYESQNSDSTDSLYPRAPGTSESDSVRRGRNLLGRGADQDSSLKFLVFWLAQKYTIVEDLGPRVAAPEQSRAGTQHKIFRTSRTWHTVCS